MSNASLRPAVRFPGIPAIVDGSEAIAHVEHQLMMKRTFEGVRPA